jgi:autotransporter-associated beta strand protein
LKAAAKTGITVLLSTVFSLFATAVLAQTTYTWTGAADGTNFGTAGNWNPVGVPNGCLHDTAQWDGVTTSNLFINYHDTLAGCGITVGLTFVLTSHQTNSVDLYSAVAISSTGNKIWSFSVGANAGAFSLGDNTPNVMILFMGNVNQLFNFVNNSTNAVTIYPNATWMFDQAGTNTLAFAGSGNWDVTNYLISANGGSTLITKSGSGTMFWTGTNDPDFGGNGSISGPLTINGGTIVLKTTNLLGPSALAQNSVSDNALLEYDEVTGGFGTLSGSIFGSGSIQVNNGTLTLSGTNTYTGSNILSGGELIAGSAEIPGSYGPLGVAGTISFIGGTLGFSVSNAFDYSSRFDTFPNQAYNIDTAGQNVTFATGLDSSGGTFSKTGANTLTLSGTSSYTGATTVNAGKLVFRGSKSGSGNISVADGAALGVFATGTQIMPSTLSLGSFAGATLEFNNVNSTTTPVISAGTVSAGGTITININSGTFAVGQSYPLLTWTSGSPPPVTLGTMNDASGTLSTNGNTIQFNVVSVVLTWTGASNGNWDTNTPGNWTPAGSPPATIWTNGESALFNDAAIGTTTVTVNSPVMPLSTTVNNSSLSYSIVSSSANYIGGTGGLLKSGTNTLALSGGANNYTGVTTINGGILSVSHLANGGLASDIGAANFNAGNLILNGGTLQFTGVSASIDRLFTLGASGGTIDNEGPGTFTLFRAGTIAMTGSGVRVLTLTGVNPSGDQLGCVLPDGSGVTSLAKQGTGTWILTGNNTYSGTTTISGGTLQVGVGFGAPSGTGSLGTSNVFDNSALVFNRTGTMTVPGAISGTGSVSQNGPGTVILANDNSYTGGTTINSGTLQVGNGGPTGSLYIYGPIVDNGTLIFNSTGTQTYETYDTNDTITGTGNVIVRAGKVTALSYDPYTGWTEIDAGATFQPIRWYQGELLSPVVTNNGTLLFAPIEAGYAGYTGNIFGTGKLMLDNGGDNVGDATLTGTNFSTGGLLIAGGYLVLGDNVNPFFGSMAPVGDVVFTNASVSDYYYRSLILNRPENFTFSNNIIGKTIIRPGFTQDPGKLILMGSGTVTLVGATNTCQGGTVISNGALVVGKGGATGGLGTGPINDQTSLTFNRSGTLNVPGNFSGTGTVAMVGSGVVNLTGLYSGLTGSTAVSNGVLGASSIGGEVDVVGGTLAVGGYQAVGTLAIGNSTVSPAVAANLNISSGAVSMALNTALTQSNSFVQMTVTNTLVTLTFNGTGYTTNITVTSATGAINYTGGLLNLVNVGPTLQPGQRFVLFSQPVAMPIGSTPGFTVINNLATDGSVTVQTVATPPVPKITKITPGNGVLTITATNNFGPGGSWELLGTNDITAPLTNWLVVTNSYFDVNGRITITTPLSTNQQFFILRAP